MKLKNYGSIALLILTLIISTSAIAESFETYFNLGVECFRQQQNEQALTHFQKAIEFEPDHAPTYFNAGLICMEQKNYSQACNYFEQAITHNPNYTKAYHFLGQSYQHLHNYDAALKHYRKVMELNPSSTDTLIAMAGTLRAQDKNSQAVEILKKALTLDPNNLITLFDLGLLNTLQEKYEDATTYYKKILSSHPNMPNVTCNLAHVLRYQGLIQEALTYYKKTLSFWPTDAHTHYGFSECSLALGDFQSGWQSFEYRWKREHNPRDFGTRLWDGSDLAGKKILIRAEYGQGDTIQFIRYAQLLKEQGATVILEAQNTLVTLLSLCPYLDTVVPVADRLEQLPAHDFQVPVMSLPYYFHTTVATIPTTIPYITAHPTLVTHWQEQLKSDTNFKIGICWEGSPYYEQFKSARSKKAVQLAAFAPIAQLPGVSLYSLQKMNGTEQLAALPQGMTIHSFNDEFDNKHGRFMDTAAVIQNLDLIITVDTSVTHLAGALGKPVWVMLPLVADWRWMIDRNDCPWYPSSMRLFRQHSMGDWTSVISTMAGELKAVLEQRCTKKFITNQLPTTLSIMAEIQIGELIDKITILQIKAQQIKDPAKLKNITTELDTLLATCKNSVPQTAELEKLWEDLLTINKSLWVIEDDIRDKERVLEFDHEFIRLARAVYYTNDERCRIKRAINELSGSRLIEEKSYRDYKQPAK
ncbi:MAG: DUF6165 family protein [Candidatus Dependentiae bacterium]|nr:DUF6165 family protein [Candidatus Dependentiae bacterium]